jgi:hypothetical protein
MPSFAKKTPAEPAVQEKKKPKKQTVKNDPKLIAAARELRDRWLERVNSGTNAITGGGKYDLTRSLEAPVPAQMRALTAA